MRRTKIFVIILTVLLLISVATNIYLISKPKPESFRHYTHISTDTTDYSGFDESVYNHINHDQWQYDFIINLLRQVAKDYKIDTASIRPCNVEQDISYYSDWIFKTDTQIIKLYIPDSLTDAYVIIENQGGQDR